MVLFQNETHHEGEKGHYLFYHQMGGDQKDDIIVYKHRDSKLSGYDRLISFIVNDLGLLSVTKINSLLC